jgi:hypothetical protein
MGKKYGRKVGGYKVTKGINKRKKEGEELRYEINHSQLNLNGFSY